VCSLSELIKHPGNTIVGQVRPFRSHRRGC
jgi:hypothetical protein